MTAQVALRIESIYGTLLDAFGPQDWWPGEGAFETIVGAVLTQGTAWGNASRAVERLRRAAALTPEALDDLRPAQLEDLIRPAGFHRRKARTVKALVRDVLRHGDGLEAYLDRPRHALRETLLRIEGIGPETADAITAYAAGLPAFVVDEYARRLGVRHGLLVGSESYDEIQALFESALPSDALVLGQFHALIVKLGKDYCRKRPLCAGCPLEGEAGRRNTVGA